MTTLDQRIRAKLQQQRTRWVGRYKATGWNVSPEQAQDAYQMSDLGACHDAIHATLDQHKLAREEDGWVVAAEEARCIEEGNLYPCATVTAIADALRVKDEGPS